MQRKVCRRNEQRMIFSNDRTIALERPLTVSCRMIDLISMAGFMPEVELPTQVISNKEIK